MPDHPEILELLKTPSDSYTFGARWHSDQMFTPEPAKATVLHAAGHISDEEYAALKAKILD